MSELSSTVGDVAVTPGDRFESLVAQLALMGNVPDNLIWIHKPDRDSKCTVCSAGPQAGRVVFPCTLYLAATRAVEVRSQRNQVPSRRPDETPQS